MLIRFLPTKGLLKNFYRNNEGKRESESVEDVPAVSGLNILLLISDRAGGFTFCRKQTRANALCFQRRGVTERATIAQNSTRALAAVFAHSTSKNVVLCCARRRCRCWCGGGDLQGIGALDEAVQLVVQLQFPHLRRVADLVHVLAEVFAELFQLFAGDQRQLFDLLFQLIDYELDTFPALYMRARVCVCL